MDERTMRCPLCDGPMVYRIRTNPPGYPAECPTCGRFRMDEGFFQQLVNAPDTVRPWAREHRPWLLRQIRTHMDVDRVFVLSWRVVGKPLS